jgi:hypothetical protein
MKTMRIVQFLNVRDSLKAIPDAKLLTFSELQEKLKEVPKGISLARYTAMVVSIAKGNTLFDDAD